MDKSCFLWMQIKSFFHYNNSCIYNLSWETLVLFDDLNKAGLKIETPESKFGTDTLWIMSSIIRSIYHNMSKHWGPPSNLPLCILLFHWSPSRPPPLHHHASPLVIVEASLLQLQPQQSFLNIFSALPLSERTADVSASNEQHATLHLQPPPPPPPQKYNTVISQSATGGQFSGRPGSLDLEMCCWCGGFYLVQQWMQFILIWQKCFRQHGVPHLWLQKAFWWDIFSMSCTGLLHTAQWL